MYIFITCVSKLFFYIDYDYIITLYDCLTSKHLFDHKHKLIDWLKVKLLRKYHNFLIIKN